MQNSDDFKNPSESLLNLESAINRTVNDVEKLKTEIKDQKDMYDSAFEQDATYESQLKKEEEVKKAGAVLKQQLSKSPAIAASFEKLKELKDDMKDLQKELSDLLKRYQKTSGTNIITREDGEIYEIVTNLKLIKKKA